MNVPCFRKDAEVLRLKILKPSCLLPSLNEKRDEGREIAHKDLELQPFRSTGKVGPVAPPPHPYPHPPPPAQAPPTETCAREGPLQARALTL